MGSLLSTNKDEFAANPDPRSPTPQITRTPLQDPSTSNLPITKKIDLSTIFQDQNDSAFFYEGRISLSELTDPRSPSIEFDRTPLVSKTKLLALVQEIEDKHKLQGKVSEADPKPTDTVEAENQKQQITEEVLREIGLKYFHNSAKIVHLKDDPRSPSEGVERTPIILVKKIEENYVDEKPPEESIVNDIKELQIYADSVNNKTSTPISQISCENITRTPLACVKNITDNLESRSSNSAKKMIPHKNVARKHSRIPRHKAFLTKPMKGVKQILKQDFVANENENSPINVKATGLKQLRKLKL